MIELVFAKTTPRYLNWLVTSIPYSIRVFLIGVEVKSALVFFLFNKRLSLARFSSSTSTWVAIFAFSNSTAMSSAYLPIRHCMHILFRSVDCLSTQSTKKLKSFGLRGEPYMTPFSTFIFFPKISIIWPCKRLKMSLTQWLVMSPSLTATCLSSSQSFLLLILSKALEKSTKMKLFPREFELKRARLVPVFHWIFWNQLGNSHFLRLPNCSLQACCRSWFPKFWVGEAIFELI